MTRKISLILKEVLKKIEPTKKELETIGNSFKEFLKKFEKRLKTLKINAEVFVGGSFAKKTMIKKNSYDVDIFVRFDKIYGENISSILEKIVEPMKAKKVHGSRDYFQIQKENLIFELIPVIKIRSPKEAKNITDLSYSHVKYINKKIKSEELLGEIKIAKAFCYANNCYGAESYIKGFSGYSLELLIYYYKNFIKFIKAVSKMGEGKIVIDIEKHHKTKQDVLMDLNSSKLNSPIILIDPTYKQRNALAALSKETFEEFKKDCKKFLKNPSIKAFEIKKMNLEKMKDSAKKNKFEYALIKTKTSKQAGDVAGSKLLKFYRHLNFEIRRFFEIKNKGFEYPVISDEIPVSKTSKKQKEVSDDEKKSADYFFVVKNKKEILIKGPNIKSLKNVEAFRKKHRNTFVKKNRIYALESTPKNLKEFINNWKKKNKQRIKDMYIEELKILEN